jgi:GNAT superfamily N-acetyltransferase
VACEIRPAQVDDAADISRVIVDALRETNAKDYTAEIIARVELSFNPVAVGRLIGQRQVFVAEIDGHIVGTASLDGEALRTMFVAPRAQGRGIGRLLVQRIEMVARERGLAVLIVPATVTAEAFYARLGFTAVRDTYYGDERTIVMERVLLPPAS